ncbi:hypothetical protein C8R44DRAFT_850221 [Mycena epipterygia]|nr:hypothetical protein C8R44DRAFT_850221 [Mycena epipterygia]
MQAWEWCKASGVKWRWKYKIKPRGPNNNQHPYFAATTIMLDDSLQPTPLPPNPFSIHSHESAYSVCVQLQNKEKWNPFVDDLVRNGPPQIMFGMGPIIAGRVLGYALIYAPNNGGRDALRGWRFSISMVLYAFVVRNPKGAPPAVSADSKSPRISLDAAGDQPRENSAPPGRIPHILKEQILFRDQFTCAFSHVIDRDSFEKGIATRHADTLGFGNVQVAHIISQSLTDGIGGMSEAAKEKHNWASCASAILDRFAGIEIRPLDLHNPMNVLLAGLEPHMNFGRQCMWLSAVKDETGNVVPEKYNVCLRKELDRCIGMREQITFQARMYKGEMILPPSADLLQLHASCAHIAHLSGAAGVLDEYERETTPFKFMTTSHICTDVNTFAADELNRALCRVQVEKGFST